MTRFRVPYRADLPGPPGTLPGMETLHVLTAVHADLAQHLGDTALSVTELRTALYPMGWNVRWHVAVDGVGPLPVLIREADTVITIGHQVGVAAARNLALAATDGTGWVFPLDGDDELDVNGWQNMVTNPALNIAFWHPTNLLTLGGARTVHFFKGYQNWNRWTLEENWTSPMPFHPGAVMARTDLALAVGGWPAMRVNEDLAWCFLLNELERGVGLPYVTFRYRKWAKQVTADRSYTNDKTQAFKFIEATVNARRARAYMPPITAPTPAPAALYGRD